MKVLRSILLDELTVITVSNKENANKYLEYSDEDLNGRELPTSWSILECFEHLNRYSDFYIPEIESRIKDKPQSDVVYFKSGWLGNYFAEMMKPSLKTKKINTFQSMNPIGSQLDKSTLRRFIAYQDQTLKIIEHCKTLNLHKIKTSISISKWIKLRLGDTLKVVVYHNQRHVVQANQVFKSLKISNKSSNF